MTALDPLAGRRIGIPESRQLDLFADMLERRGATVARCPLVDIRAAPDPAPVRAWVDDIATHGLDAMIWLTGEGVRRLRSFTADDPPGDRERFWRALGAARTITRGPKPVRELKADGIDTDLPAATPTTAGVIAALSDIDLAGHRVGVQLYGTDPNTPLMEALAEHGATAIPVAPYVYADQAENAAVETFIRAIVAGELDAVAFTSSPQVRRLFKVAGRGQRSRQLTEALQDRCVAAVGPLVADALCAHEVRVDLMPESSYFMKPLVRLLSAYFAERAPGAQI
ncbi:uroporphyrinogen-III synthase [Salinisphaera sp.]|uniref:uroporphyrinogen-III synthase n=1 Tax=Salinisphaera sp. TaxID=1914330 RepID=UPI002D76850C|nr:uroporphyrinogen-III synthase [Salinisphaera sp.]HET7313530.1 uroporphyrinogen-III synthase [Salinisphaera sp.]